MVPLREENANGKKRLLTEENDCHELEFHCSTVKKLRDDITSLLHDKEPDPVNEALGTVAETLEHEICVPTFEPTIPVIDLASIDIEKQWQELGYLTEATDDELGLPPPNATFGAEAVNEEIRQDNVLASGIGRELLRLGSNFLDTPEEHMTCFDALDVWIDQDMESVPGDFGFSKTHSAGLDFSDLLWWPDSMPATQ